MIMKKSILLFFFVLLAAPLNSSALERFEIITTSEMVQLLKDRKEGSIDFLLVNALDKMIYNHSSIPGSIHIPLDKLQDYANKLGSDTDKMIIPY
jgi:hypothetical protein